MFMKVLFEKRNNMPLDPESVRRMAKKFGLGSMLAELLLVRGILEDTGAFLSPDIRNMHDPLLFSDMDKAVGTIRVHISERKKIAVFGDYDSDGVCAAAILYRTLQMMKADVSVFLPNRSEGYGLSLRAVSEIAQTGAQLLITVDCGISSVQEVCAARDTGMAVVITDHHECPSELPVADAIINPKRKGESYPFRELAGGGVAFKLATALIGKHAFELIDIAAVATIGDVVPLLGENRIIAAKGLYKLNAAPAAGLDILMKEAGLKKRPIDSEGVAFGLVPRINASGRMEDPQAAFELICGQKDRTELTVLAKKLCVLNAKRQSVQESIIRKAFTMAEEYAKDRVLVLQDDGWDTGIVGLAASALTGAFVKPALLFGMRDGLYVGSARSVPGVNIYEALSSNAGLLEAFGGHEAAAGMTIKKESLKPLREALGRYLDEKYTEEDFLMKAYYDAETSLSEVDGELVSEIKRLMPFGCGNESVKLLLRQVDVLEKRPIGDGSHSRLKIAQDGAVMDAVAFKTKCDEIPARADVLATPQINDYNGNVEVVLNVISF